MQHDIYLYLFVMSAVTLAIRLVPLTLIRRQIKTVLCALFSIMYPM